MILSGRYRASLIQKVLVNEVRLKVAYDKKVALMKKEEKQMQHLLEESIAQERKRMEQSAEVNAKIERAKKCVTVCVVHPHIDAHACAASHLVLVLLLFLFFC